MITENFWFDGDIGNIPGVNISQLSIPQYYDGSEVNSNTKTYRDICSEIENEVYEIAKDCGGQGFDAVDDGEMERARKCVESIFNKCAEIIKNTETRVSSSSTVEEIDKILSEFKNSFVAKLMFSAGHADIPSRMYLSDEAHRGVFTRDDNFWAYSSKSTASRTMDNGGYRLMSQFIDRLYKIFTTTRDKVIALCSAKKKSLGVEPPKNGAEPPKTGNPGSGTEPPKNGVEPPKTIESRIRSLFNKKSRLEQKQASLIKEIKSLTTEARRIYVRQFLNEDDTTNTDANKKKITHAEANKIHRDIDITLDGKKPNMSSMEEYQKSVNGQKPSTPPTSNEKTDGDETTSTTSTIKVPSNNPVYTAIKGLLARRDQLFKYYEDSVSYFNKISKNAKYLQDLMSGKYKDFRNMSMKDRISAFNNAKYEFKDNSKATDAAKAAQANQPAPIQQPTEQKPLPTTTAPGSAPTNAGPSAPQPQTSPTPTESGNTQTDVDSTQRTN